MLRSLNHLRKCRIGATDGPIGDVTDFYLDDLHWIVRFFVVDTGTWLESRKVLISPSSLGTPDWSAFTLPVTLTRKQVRNSPDIDTELPVSRQQEAIYLAHYGNTSYWGAGLLGGGLLRRGLLPIATYPEYPAFPVGTLEPVAGDAESAAHALTDRTGRQDDDPHLRSCKTVIGYHVDATDGEVGHIDEMLVDDQTWSVRYLVVNTSNWWLGHKVLIAPQWITGVHWEDETVAVDLSCDAVKRAPPYDADATLDRSSETILFSHYQRAPYWGPGTVSVGAAKQRR